MRVSAGTTDSVLDGISLRWNDLTVRIGSRCVRLSPTEFALIRTLAHQPGRTFARTELLAEVWGEEGRVSSRTVDAHMMNLRKKLAHLPKSSWQIQTVWCIGYKLKSQKHPDETRP